MHLNGFGLSTLLGGFVAGLVGGTSSGAATFTVTNTNDSGPGSLRQAIQSATFGGGTGNRVEFNIPGGGVQTIVLAPGSPLIVNGSMTIDGFTQPGSKPNSLPQGIDAVLLIQIRGEVRVFADNCTVRGLVINNSATTGLTIQGSGCLVEGCFIGTDPTGTVGLGNDLEGVRVAGFRAGGPNRIGGNSPAARNLISGNQMAGITVQSTTVQTIIQGNYIGTDATGRRTIGNGGAGIRIFGNDSPDAAITVGGINPGEGNRIAFNGSGVWVAAGSRNGILGNAFSGNLGLAIDIGGAGAGATLAPDGETPNDSGDADTGPNGLQNHPVITSLSEAAGATTIQGTLNSRPNASYRVEFFANTVPDPHGLGEGEQFLGAKDVTTDAAGAVSFTATFTGVQSFVSATATDADGNTSEFATVLLPPRTPFAVGDVFVSGNIDFVQRFAAEGSLRDILHTDANGGPTYGMAFDPAGNLYVSGRENSALAKFDSQGALIGVVAEASDGFSWFVRFDAAGNAYVSSALGSFGLRKFSPQGVLVQEFELPRAGFFGATSFDLSADGRVIYYALEGTTFLGTVYYETRVRRYDLIAKAPLPDFATNLLGNVRAVELLTDGGALVGVESEILRLNGEGEIVQRYDFFGEDSWSAIARSADDQSFWAGADLSTWIYRFDLATGQMLQRVFVGTVDEPSLVVKRGTLAPTTPGAPATIAVTNTGDSGPGSLRAAIESANSKSGRDTISFNIAGAGPHTIRPASPLPEIKDPVIIDGYSQTGSQLNSASGGALPVLQVILDGSTAGPLADGLTIAAGQSVVKGLAIIRFLGNGLVLMGAGHNQIFGNHIGIDPAGDAAGNQKNGILVADSWLNQIGSSAPADFNVISANAGAGIACESASAGGNTLAGNLIGLGRTPETGLGNAGAGVLVTQSENLIVGNRIAFNRGPGVEVYGSLDLNRFRTWRFQEASGVLIQENSIHSNGGLGIDLMPSGVNVNDEGSSPDRDAGPNQRLNYPSLDPPVAGSQSIAGEWISPGNSGVTIELFTNSECDPGGYGEGRTYLGRAEANTDANGRATFTAAVGRPLIEGEFITAVAIASDHDTSEFSPCHRVSQPIDLELSVAPSPSPVVARGELTYTFTIRNQGPGPATDVQLGIAVPLRTQFISTSTSCEPDFRGAVNCQWPLLAPLESVTATLVVRPKFSGSVTLAASVSAAELDLNPTNNVANAETRVTGEARNLVVTNTDDSGAGSLRAAIEQVNASGAGLDTITFNIPGAGVKVLKPASDFPRIEVPVMIDGYTQPGSRPNTDETSSDAVILIEIQGSPDERTPDGGVLIGTGVAHGFQFLAPGCVVRGLSINSCSQRGIRVEVRDPLPNDPPTVIEGCFIGTDALGFTAKGNLNSGIELDTGQGRIGGPLPAARNVISANGNPEQKIGPGISLGFTAAALIQGNLIGTDASGVGALGNIGAGVEVRSEEPLQSIIGGRELGAGNVIAFNGGSGVDGQDNTVVGNSIFANGALGIGRTRPTANDAGDPLEVTSGFAHQNFPELSTRAFSGGATTVTGVLASRPNETFTIDFYSNSEPDDSFFGEGETYLGSKEVTTDPAGRSAFDVSFTGRHPFVSATATDVRGRTSEFSPVAPALGRVGALGDLFIALDTGYVQWRRANGEWVGLLDTGLHPESIIQATSGAALDSQGSLYVSGRPLLQRGNPVPISRFSSQGEFIGTMGESGTRPLGMIIDAVGNLLVASPESGSDLNIYDASGKLLEKLDLPNERSPDSSGRPADLVVQWIDLAPDQRTLCYTSQAGFLASPSKQVKRYDLMNRTALPDFAPDLPGNDAQQFRLLPEGGGILANTEFVLRLDANGQRTQTYDIDGEDQWNHVAVAPDGKSFWAAGGVSLGGPPLMVYRFEVTTGQVLSQIAVGANVAIHALTVSTAAGSPGVPRLTITLGNNRRVRLNWPESAADFRLETTTSLTQPVSWTAVTPAPAVENGQFVLRTEPVDTPRFYRLRKP